MLIATTASEILKEIAEYLKLSSIWSDSWRFIGWQIIKLFMFISQQLSKSLTEIYKIFDIIDSPEILKIMNGLVPVAWAIGSVALGIYGIKYMGNPNMKLKKGIKNMVLGVAVISLSSVFLTQIVNVTKNLATTINAETSDLVSYSILNSNMYDLYKLEENNYDIDSDFHTNINNDNINFIDINETVDEMKLKRPLTGENIFGKKLIVDRNGKVYISSLDKHWMFLVKERYYRYNWHPFQIMAGLGILIAVYFFTSIKTVKLIFEMIYSLTMLKVTAFTDFENAQIVKKIIKNIWNVLLTLILITFLLYVYGIVYTLISTLAIGNLTKLLIQIGLGMAVIDGPTIIQEITGIDGGLKSIGMTVLSSISAGKAMAATAKGFGKTVVGTPKAIKNGAKKVQSGIDSGISFAHKGMGFANGLANGFTGDKLNKAVKEKMNQSNDMPLKDKSVIPSKQSVDSKNNQFAEALNNKQKPQQSDKQNMDMQNNDNNMMNGVEQSSMNNQKSNDLTNSLNTETASKLNNKKQSTDNNDFGNNKDNANNDNVSNLNESPSLKSQNNINRKDKDQLNHQVQDKLATKGRLSQANIGATNNKGSEHNKETLHPSPSLKSQNNINRKDGVQLNQQTQDKLATKGIMNQDNTKSSALAHVMKSTKAGYSQEIKNSLVGKSNDREHHSEASNIHQNDSLNKAYKQSNTHMKNSTGINYGNSFDKQSQVSISEKDLPQTIKEDPQYKAYKQSQKPKALNTDTVADKISNKVSTLNDRNFHDRIEAGQKGENLGVLLKNTFKPDNREEK
ncbi:pLS20_p028 family conjugation system transmembrane protein [Granulicatella balaenopterae]|nr:hypothetical protein [Granulicatella balaenopterae]